ncbi:hypothetical protein NPIL_661981 [Nephila pilipes]|uniref:Uncharacterized protein n=1 Tax=Nephila pilipes TaxID=299642 RepID=A0A8X6TTD0_NEPPI|nr:hypothetical protein NPIL_661981 [Nephila pilipes]
MSMRKFRLGSLFCDIDGILLGIHSDRWARLRLVSCIYSFMFDCYESWLVYCRFLASGLILTLYRWRSVWRTGGDISVVSRILRCGGMNESVLSSADL